ncbi:hypothetical protein Tco_1510971, partial [Tanacetum coccineum]
VMSLSESHATVTYTSISCDSNLPPWGFHLMDPNEFEAPQSLEQAPPSLDYVPGPEHPPLPDYVPGPEYPEYLVLSDDEISVEDQPLPADASSTALSSGYVADLDLEEDPKEDPEEDPADYPNEEEEHLAPTDSILPFIDSDPSAEEMEPFETDEARISVRPHTPPSPSTEALIVEFAYAPTPPSPPPSPLSPWSSPLPQIPSPLLPVLSPPLPLPSPPTYTSPPYADVPLGYRAAMVQRRATSPPPVPSPPLVPSPPFSAARQTGHTLAHRVDYGFIDAVDASIRASKSRVMTAVGEDDRALLRAQVSLLMRERRYFRSMAFSYEREVVIARQAWSRSEDRSTALETTIRAQDACTAAL